MSTAKGTFAVEMQKQPNGPGPGLSRFTMDKVWQGDFVGTSHGEMLSGGDPAKGEAGYVAIERLEGTLLGKHGSFALEHQATMDKSGPAMRVLVVPGSGTDGMTGITGTLQILIEGKQHSYLLEYEMELS